MMRRYAPVVIGIVLILLLVGYSILFSTGRLAMPQATEQPMRVCIEAQSGAIGESCSEED